MSSAQDETEEELLSIYLHIRFVGYFPGKPGIGQLSRLSSSSVCSIREHYGIGNAGFYGLDAFHVTQLIASVH